MTDGFKIYLIWFIGTYLLILIQQITIFWLIKKVGDD